MKQKLGVIINPYAGLGGRVGLKGSDGPDIVERALAMGGVPEAAKRASLALELLTELAELPEILTYGGDMGEAELTALGISHKVLGSPKGERSTAQDTIDAAKLMLEAGCDLLLFAGGDGTARNICEAIGESIPVIGIPAGVKIHSAVYAINPRNAGLAAVEYLSGRINHTHQAAVMDIDEEKFRDGIVTARLYGHMQTPNAEDHIQVSKSGAQQEEDQLLDMAEYAADQIRPGITYIIGPGSTTRAVMEELELPNTLLGVDVIRDDEVLLSDASEHQLWDLLEQTETPVKIMVTIIGGQGNLFGRGNQQLSPRILKRVGKENLIVISTPGKLQALEGRPLRVDTGDPELDRALSGYIEIITGYQQLSLYKVSD